MTTKPDDAFRQFSGYEQSTIAVITRIDLDAAELRITSGEQPTVNVIVGRAAIEQLLSHLMASLCKLDGAAK